MKIAFISDIHEDLINLQKAIVKIEDLQCDEIICLGDISGFSSLYHNHFDRKNAHECLQIVKENCSTIVLGNHDLFALRSIPGMSPEFNYPNKWYNLEMDERKKLSKGMLWLYDDDLDPNYNDNDLSFLSDYKEYQIKNIADRNILLSHYIYPDMSGSLKRFHHFSDDFEEHFNYTNFVNCSISIVGHAHPKGLFVASKNEIIQDEFCKIKLNEDEMYCIVCPPILHAGNPSGFIVYDTDQNTIEAVAI